MLACPQCGGEIGPGKKFCRSCGAALSSYRPGGPSSPASYTPKHLAEKILTSKAALEGERKQVTVLFADLKGSMELLGPLLGPDAGLNPLKALLIVRTEGNPFFLEESVRTLVETGALAGERGAYRLARRLPAVEVPATVQAVLAARVDRLSPGDKALLQTASVVGKDVRFALLQGIAEQPEEQVREAVGRLQAAEFLYEAGIFPDLEYTFKHSLTHDVAYGSLLQNRRRTLHRQIVENIERLYPDRLTEHVERLAHHAVRGEVWDKAVTYLRQAGTKAFARSANQEAVAHLEQALTALTHLSETRETRAQAVDVRLRLRNSLYLLGALEQVIRYLLVDGEGLSAKACT
jgi:predicted ATPase